jgi:hypothetical protein
MAVLTAASKANAALILPAVLAATYAAYMNPRWQITVDYKDVESLGAQNEKLELTTEDGDVVIDDSILLYFHNNVVPLRHGKRSEVCFPYFTR